MGTGDVSLIPVATESRGTRFGSSSSLISHTRLPVSRSILQHGLLLLLTNLVDYLRIRLGDAGTPLGVLYLITLALEIVVTIALKTFTLW